MKSKNGVPEPPKAGGQEKKPLTVSDVEGLLKRDLHACLLMLQALRDDQDVLSSLAVVLHGKYMNKLHKDELDKQLEIQP